MTLVQETNTTPNQESVVPKPVKLNRAQLREAAALSRGTGTQSRRDAKKVKYKNVAKRKTQRASRKANRK